MANLIYMVSQLHNGKYIKPFGAEYCGLIGLKLWEINNNDDDKNYNLVDTPELALKSVKNSEEINIFRSFRVLHYYNLHSKLFKNLESV